MVDVTEMVQRYRLALRYIWNSAIWVDPDLRDWESVDSFRELQLPLFKALVANPLGFEPEKVFGDRFRVVLDSEGSGSIFNLQVNERLPDNTGAGVWTLVRGSFENNDLSMALLDFFDWSPMGYIDLRYYRVRVESCPTHPEVVGHDALLDVAGVRVLWMEPTDAQTILDK